MPRVLSPFLVVTVLALAACGGPKAGTSCDKEGFTCADKDTALECRANATGKDSWVELPCRGPGGCDVSGTDVSCDIANNLVGDACASTMENKGICAADGKSALVCRSGRLIKASNCVTCTVENDQVVCQP